ncbi:MAG: single-stranded DNA-binding protein [Myxococcales bacterium]|nr:single-stranded DNA-binding protein [Myxococcales bacterium]MDH5307218.1 single-stranded DNA-binding protein [Myxococcales bacterium]MDH5565096.1 single-stranded DNA-binding protein [Myxococcales bacterium]
MSHALAVKVRAAARALCRDVAGLRFAPPVTHVYNPLEYARRAHEAYVDAYAAGPKRVVFLGMNPGPFGMAQTGVPFGDVAQVRDWLGIEAPVARPAREHPKRPIQGFACPRNEVSGTRLWGEIRRRFARSESFFAEHYVANYCPLVFLEHSGRNRTPDKLPAAERRALFAACDRHLRRLVALLEPEWVVGIGAFAEARAREALPAGVRVGRILHPSPANPRAQKNWGREAARELAKLGVCRSRSGGRA